MKKLPITALNFKKMKGLIPAIIQDEKTKEIRMLGFMNQTALLKTLKEGRVCFWSRTRQKLWTKGENSGNFLQVKKLYTDCDQDSLLILVKPKGPTCHTGKKSCFFRIFRSGPSRS